MSELKTTSECIETICVQGCTVVREVIIKLETDVQVSEFKHLSKDQQKQVLIELKSVMSVYDAQDDSQNEQD